VKPCAVGVERGDDCAEVTVTRGLGSSDRQLWEPETCPPTVSNAGEDAAFDKLERPLACNVLLPPRRAALLRAVGRCNEEALLARARVCLDASAMRSQGAQ